MAVTLSVRAGSSLVKDFEYLALDGQPVPSDGYTARLQIRGLVGTRRIVLITEATSDPSDPLSLVDNSHWVLNLNADVTRSLPSSAQFELELVNDADSTDVRTLDSGAIYVIPQGVVSA